MAELKIISMDEVEPTEVKWLWYPYIPFGKITIVHGDPGDGKTMMILQLASLLSLGEKLPCDDTEREPIKIIYQTAEDGLSDTIKPRLLAGNADCSQIKVIDESEAALSLLDERVEQAIIETGAKVIILDPVQAYIGAKVDMNKAKGNKANYRGLGSIDFQAAARSVLVVGRLKDKQNIRVMAHEKSSLAPEGEPIAFELDKENGFAWKGHYDISIDDLLNGFSKETKTQQAENLIKDCLLDGKQANKVISKKAENIGISKRVLDEAKKSLGVISTKANNQWYWQLPG